MTPLKFTAHHRVFDRIIEQVGHGVLAGLESIVGLPELLSISRREYPNVLLNLSLQ